MVTMVSIPNLGEFTPESGLIPLEEASAGGFRAGQAGVSGIYATGDRKVEFIAFDDHALGLVNSALGYPAFYPVLPISYEMPAKAVLMDLDGTSVRSETFWIWIIEQVTAGLLGNPRFSLEDADLPFVSGHSVSEHLQYAVNKYCPDRTLEEARRLYFEITEREMNEIVEGRGRADAFVPSPGLKPFLLALKEHKIKIGLATSGLYQKAYPEILAAFRTLGMGDPKQFYDAIITAGYPLKKGATGTLGELCAKPHPWLYSEVYRVGLGLPFEERHHVLGIEDSGAGVCAIRLAGFTTVGYAGGNIIESGTAALCSAYCSSFEEILDMVV